MAETTYTYSISADFPNALADAGNMSAEIIASPIVIALKSVVKDPVGDDSDRIDIIFKDALSAGDKTLLDGDTTGPAGGLIAAHNHVTANDPTPVTVEEFKAKSGPEESIRVYPAPNRQGLYRNDRDLKLMCGVWEDVAGTPDESSFEDLKVDNTTFEQIPWNEMKQVGCYKWNGSSFVHCDNQADATANATLTVWDFHPHDQTLSQNKISWDIKGGALKVAPILDGDKSEHRFYAAIAPNIPYVNARVFDSYLERDEGKTIESMNEIAVFLDVNQSSEMTRLRIWCYYPAGSTVEHIFRLVTYRPLGTF